MKEKIKFNVVDETPNQDEELDTIQEPTEDLPAEELPVDEISADENTPIEDDIEEKFYASGKYDELRSAMQDTDFRLYLINDDLVIPGTLDGNEIQFLDIVGEDEDEEFVMKPAPSTLKELLEFKTLYNTENTEIEIPEGTELSEAPHEKIVEYILNLKVSEQDADDVEDDEQEIDAKEREEEDDDESNEE